MDNKKLSQLDLFYRAFKQYKELVAFDVSFNRVKKSSRALNNENHENIIVTTVNCKIESDWVEAIEKGLPFIEKCILEERQFIRVEGDVLPIEKIRKTSKQSVIDLSKHSNYISHLPENGDDSELIPDKLLMINKDNEYNIYENRVLLSCLEYLKDFISIRLNDIKGQMNAYKAKSYINKKIKAGNYSIDYKMELNEEILNDPLVIQKSGVQDIVNRIDVCLESVMALIKTPIMMEVAKSERVKRPITRTNILRMDHNFREMLATFDYIAEYQGKGYEIITTEKQLTPLSLSNVDDYSELIVLSSFITYMYANELDSDLEVSYQKEEENRRIESEKELLERIDDIRNHYSDKAKNDKEKLLIMDEALRIYEAKVNEFDKKNKELEHKINTETTRLTEEFNKQKEQMVNNHQKEVEELNSVHSSEMQKITDEKEKEISDLKETYESEIKQKDLEISTMTQRVKEMEDELAKTKAEMFAVRVENGMGPEPKDLSSKERFDELEDMKRSIDELFEKSWKLTKKDIRHRLFSEKPPKKVKKKG